MTLSQPEQLFTDNYDMRFLLDPRKRMKDAEWEEWLQNWMYEFVSPITNKPFEPWHQEFSPGNGYFQLLVDPVNTGRLWALVSEEDQQKFPRPDVFFMYYRIYGEKKPIAEGFYAGYIGADPIERAIERERIERKPEERLIY